MIFEKYKTMEKMKVMKKRKAKKKMKEKKKMKIIKPKISLFKICKFIFLLYLFYLLILFKVKFNKSIKPKNVLPVPVPLPKPRPRPIFSSPSKRPVSFSSRSVRDLLNCNIENNTVLIFEPALYHHECTPGFTKYFLDLGYNVDIILDGFGRNTFCFFNSLENVRLFTFYGLSQFSDHSSEFQLIFKNYSYIVIETSDGSKKPTFENLGFYKMNNTIFVVHQHEYINSTGIVNLSSQNRVWSLGNLKDTLYVNPHYFGDFKIRSKNNRTRFFITSTIGRYYNDLVLAAQKIKNESLDFEVIVIGKVGTFNDQLLSENLKENFKFKYRVVFRDLYEAVNSSDYIIINLYPNYTNNDDFRSTRLTGASQLSFGFLKPALIHKDFAEFYNMSSENSFLYDNYSFYDAMREAILLNEQGYKQKQENLSKLSETLYNISLDNVIKTLNSIY